MSHSRGDRTPLWWISSCFLSPFVSNSKHTTGTPHLPAFLRLLSHHFSSFSLSLPTHLSRHGVKWGWKRKENWWGKGLSSQLQLKGTSALHNSDTLNSTVGVMNNACSRWSNSNPSISPCWSASLSAGLFASPNKHCPDWTIFSSLPREGKEMQFYMQQRKAERGSLNPGCKELIKHS